MPRPPHLRTEPVTRTRLTRRTVLKAGGTMGLGGDYGFAWTPHGTYAQELTFFVNYVGFSPLDTIKCATLGWHAAIEAMKSDPMPTTTTESHAD